MSVRSDRTVELPAAVMPDQSGVSFHGRVSISRTTVTVLKAPSRRSGEPLFIGVCSTPLVQFYRSKDTITLLRGSSYLFDNAALSAGLAHTPASTPMSAGGDGALDNPTAWTSVSARFESLGDCDAAVEALLSRRAEEVFAPPFPPIAVPHPTTTAAAAGRASTTNGSPLSTLDSYRRHNEFRSARSNDHSRNSRNETPSQRSASSARRPASSARISDGGPAAEGRNSAMRQRPVVPVNATDGSTTPRSSRLPSRRESDDTSSSRLPSRREHDDAASSARHHNHTATQSIRSSRRVDSRREIAATPSHHRRNDDATPANGVGGESPSRRRTRSATKRRAEARPVHPTEREFHDDRRHESRRKSRASSTGSRHHRRDPSAYMGYSNSVTPRSATTAGRQRSEQEQFFRTVQKVHHHRLHFMQYLHKEMVFQAYLAAEATVAAGAPGGRSPRTASARRRGGADTPRSSSRAAVEASRLQEIEVRMAEVEGLHREAEREREAAARLRREYEWKLDELNNNHNSTANPNMGASRSRAGMGGGSRDPSEFNSTIHGPPHLRQGQVMLISENGSATPMPYGVVRTGAAGGGGAMIPFADGNAGAPPPDVGVAIVDRYIFGDEWGRLYPAHEADVRFNAQIDVCLAMKVPRERVTITNVVVDQPGLRVTAEISHDHNALSREAVERRIHGSPFRFLQRMYEMRDLFDPENAAASAGLLHSVAAGPVGTITNSRRASSAFAGPGRSRSSQSLGGPGTAGSYGPGALVALGGSRSLYMPGDSELDYEARREALHQRQEERARAARDRFARKQRQLNRDVLQRVQELLEAVEDDEEASRRRVGLAEATTRQQLVREARGHQRASAASAAEGLELAEAVARAAIEVAAARQYQSLAGVHRQRQQLAALVAGEQQRRRAIGDQERHARQTLDRAMNPASGTGPFSAAAREQQARDRAAQAQRRQRAAEEAAADLAAEERAARAALATDEMADWLGILCNAPDSRPSRAPSVVGSGRATLRQLLAEVAENESEDRALIAEEEARHRALYWTERVFRGEAAERDAIEGDELARRGAIIDGMVQQNRRALERRVADREQLATLISEEQFYRSTILADEQDAFEVIAEMFAEALKDLLARVAAAEEADDDDGLTPRRRHLAGRQVKPFHYMTFSPEDMDFAPNAVLAIEGILGCGINKNLEVTSIARPLPKAEEEELQFQAGDMILDVAGHSLHSLSHLREVLSSRTMQVQGEAREEFPDVPEAELTTNPALQKYIEVLCEHHNFLVQVLRGCDIFQIIVKS